MENRLEYNEKRRKRFTTKGEQKEYINIIHT